MCHHVASFSFKSGWKREEDYVASCIFVDSKIKSPFLIFCFDVHEEGPHGLGVWFRNVIQHGDIPCLSVCDTA